MNAAADAACHAECAHEFLYQIAVTLRAVLAREPALHNRLATIIDRLNATP